MIYKYNQDSLHLGFGIDDKFMNKLIKLFKKSYKSKKAFISATEKLFVDTDKTLGIEIGAYFVRKEKWKKLKEKLLES